MQAAFYRAAESRQYGCGLQISRAYLSTEISAPCKCGSAGCFLPPPQTVPTVL
ncbi:hypothetical protein HMPREF9098_1698 [Kingella denitrificans ATCC 33394]|uniref:Uncharacterized protein n=1 Tax=Kingella denitrificans ATCC 33394 TaxID=888741 RepID=F0F0R3_9NEIS|nr:hypothetical protein HMPREF9098_1698 [Kingella denitrificans ATCC 33394]